MIAPHTSNTDVESVMSDLRWTKHMMSDTLRRLGEEHTLTRAQSHALEMRVRSEVVARFGSMHVALAPIAEDHVVMPQGVRGVLRMLLRPAAAFAAIAAVFVGAIVVLQAPSGSRATPEVAGRISTTAVVANTTPVVPGSGTSLTVFPGVIADARTTPAAPIRATTPGSGRVFRGTAVRNVNPTPGVFTQWGTHVFTDDEVLRAHRVDKQPFTS